MGEFILFLYLRSSIGQITITNICPYCPSSAEIYYQFSLFAEGVRGAAKLCPAMASFLSAVSTRGFCTSMRHLGSVNHVTVIGAGLMGSGIVQVTAQAGINVTMVDMNEDLLKKSTDRIGKSLSRLVKKKFADDTAKGKAFMTKTMGHISTGTDAVAAVGSTDVVIEAGSIVGNREVRRKLFSSLDAAAPQHTIFTSSVLPIGDIAAATSRQDRFGGYRFYGTTFMELLKVVRIRETSDETYQTLSDLGMLLGEPVTIIVKNNSLSLIRFPAKTMEPGTMVSPLLTSSSGCTMVTRRSS